jgi:rhodanese-related sulfurtransferase
MATNIDRSQLLSLIESGATVLDVLPTAEYQSGRIPGALSQPLRNLSAESVGHLDRAKPVVVY